MTPKEQKIQKITQSLIDHDVNFTVHNNGRHLIIHAPSGEIIDFWPGTERWLPRELGATAFGTSELLVYLADPYVQYVTCPNCQGSGEGLYDGSICRRCRGEGEVRK